MDRVTQIDTNRCAQEENGHIGRKEERKEGRKEVEDRQTNPKRLKSSPGVMRKVAQREMQRDVSQNKMKHW